MQEQNEQAPATQKPQKLFPNHVSIAEIGPELNPDDPPCERTVRNLLDTLDVPYIKLAGLRWYDRNDVRNAILAREVNREPRRPGRPRKPV